MVATGKRAAVGVLFRQAKAIAVMRTLVLDKTGPWQWAKVGCGEATSFGSNGATMRIIRIAAGVPALVLSAQLLSAQQPGAPQRPERRADSMMDRAGMAQQQMQMMDSLNARLDTLVSRMNRATGNKKVTAMADVINELVAQRKAMQERMHRMMESRRGMMMMPMGGEQPPGEGRAPKAAADSATADSAAHAEHHPPN